ncbi:MAG: YihY/virulence factor BrkB family protein [Aureliella sp.]
MLQKLKDFGGLIKQTFTEFSNDDCLSMAAALAYYTVFSLPPLLVIVISVAGMFWNRDAIQGSIEGEVQGMVGESGKEQIHSMIAQASQPQGRGLATAIGVVVLLVGATGAFAQLQHSLNKAWEVEPDPEQGGIKNFILKRILSLGMVLAMAFLLLVSLILTTVLSAAGHAMGGLLPSGISAVWPIIINFVVSFLVIWLLFAAMFKFLPDANIDWEDVWIGAAITALLFMIGKALIGVYLGTQAHGAGPVILILLWIYYSASIVLIGAEFTQVWARSYGKQIQPKAGAVRVERTKEYARHKPQPAPAFATAHQPQPVAAIADTNLQHLAERVEEGEAVDDTDDGRYLLIGNVPAKRSGATKKLLVPLCLGGFLWYWWSSRRGSGPQSY